MCVWLQNILWFIILYYRYKERVNNSRIYEESSETLIK